jgi:cellulose biosynthesis protein BcsQ
VQRHSLTGFSNRFVEEKGGNDDRFRNSHRHRRKFTSGWVAWPIDDLRVQPDSFVGWVIIIVSSGFDGKSREKRKKIALAGLDDVHIEWLELLTPIERQWAGSLPINSDLEDIPLWPDALAYGKLLSRSVGRIVFPSELSQTLLSPLIVTFYSLRGGVGRSTALAYTARILAARGQKVICVDMDLEVPSLATLFGKEEHIRDKYDLLHFLITLDQGENADISQYLLRIDDSTELSCLPVGKPDANYARLLRFIDIEAWYREERNPLHLLMELLQNETPDVILFDASTGFTPFSSPLLFDLSDLVIMTYFPNPQTMTAMPPVVQALLAAKTRRQLKEQELALTPEPRFLLSPIPASKLSQYKQQALENIAEWLSILKEQGNRALVPSEITSMVPYREVIATSDFILSDERAKIEVWRDYEPVAEWIERFLPMASKRLSTQSLLSVEEKG